MKMRSRHSLGALGCAALFIIAAVITSSVTAATSPASPPLSATTTDFTPAQRLNTLKVLRTLTFDATAAPAETASISSTTTMTTTTTTPAAVAAADADFCAWPGVTCHRLSTGAVGAEVTISHSSLLAAPLDVDASQVRITALKVRTPAYSVADSSAFLTQIAKATTGSTLTTLDFTGTNMTATLPATWGTFVSLQHLRLANNNFYGTIPSAWSALTQLEEFRLQNNKVTGTLPPSWTTMTKMIDMTLDNNSLTGTLPVTWATMTALTTLSLKGNAFCGGVPAEWAAAMPALVLTADDAFYESCTTSSSSSSSSGGGSGSATRTTSTTASPSSQSTTSTTTTEPPAVLTDCDTPHCVLCPVTAPTKCSACRPGYVLTSSRTCSGTGRNSVGGPAKMWSAAVTVSAVTALTAVLLI